MKIECERCGEIEEVTASTVTAPFACRDCQEVDDLMTADPQPFDCSTGNVDQSEELIRDLQQQLADSCVVNRDLEEQLNGLAHVVEAYSQDYADLEGKLNVVRSAAEGYAKVYGTQLATNERLWDNIIDSAKRNDDLNAESDSLAEEIVDLDKENDILVEEIDECEEHIEDLTFEVERLEDENDDLRAAVINVMNKLVSMTLYAKEAIDETTLAHQHEDASHKVLADKIREHVIETARHGIILAAASSDRIRMIETIAEQSYKIDSLKHKADYFRQRYISVCERLDEVANKSFFKRLFGRQ